MLPDDWGIVRSDLPGRRSRRRDFVRWAVPDAAAERGDVDLHRVVRVWNHAVAPLEVVAGNAPPGFAAVGGTPSRGLESGGVQQLGISRIYRHIANMLILRENVAPLPTAIGGEEDAPFAGLLGYLAAPCGQVQT
jgi:hypothetical protein